MKFTSPDASISFLILHEISCMLKSDDLEKFGDVLLFICMSGGRTCGIWKFLGQKVNLSRSWDPCHSCNNAGSLTLCATAGTPGLCFTWDYVLVSVAWLYNNFSSFVSYCRLLKISVRMTLECMECMESCWDAFSVSVTVSVSLYIYVCIHTQTHTYIIL